MCDAQSSSAPELDEAPSCAKRPIDDEHGQGEKRPRNQAWFNAAGDGGRAGGSASSLQAAVHKAEVAAAVSSIKSKLSRPKDVSAQSAKPTESARRMGLTREEKLADQARHREKMEANGKAVPYYRKN